MSAAEFDRDTALEARPGGFRAEVASRWNIAGRPNGGYLIALAARAIGGVVGPPDPLTVTGHYLRPPEAGPADIDVEVVRSGRAHATAEARLRQGEREFLRVLGTFSDLAAARGPTRVGGAPPALPPPDACTDIHDLAPSNWQGMSGFLDRLHLRLAPPGTADIEDGIGRIQGWVRFADGRPADPYSLLLFADAFPPAVLSVAPAKWIPTVELTVHVRARPAPGWLAATFRTRFLVDGYLEEDGEVWDSEGRLVALSRQLAIAR